MFYRDRYLIYNSKEYKHIKLGIFPRIFIRGGLEVPESLKNKMMMQ